MQPNRSTDSNTAMRPAIMQTKTNDSDEDDKNVVKSSENILKRNDPLGKCFSLSTRRAEKLCFSHLSKEVKNTPISDAEEKSDASENRIERCTCKTPREIPLNVWSPTFREYGKKRNALDVFTDGSVCGEFSSAAFVIPSMDIERSWRLTKGSSIFTAELISLLMALLFIEDLGVACIRIFSDSLSALNEISSSYQSDHHIASCICHLLDRLTKARVRVKLFWIPSHVNICGNERVDKLAVMAHYDPKTPFLENTLSESEMISLRTERSLFQSDEKRLNIHDQMVLPDDY